MMQGDSYGIKIDVLDSAGAAVTESDVTEVEIAIGSLIKTYSRGEVKFSDGQWIFPLSQKESFKLPATNVKAQVRVVLKNGAVEGASLGDIRVHESISKVVL